MIRKTLANIKKPDLFLIPCLQRSDVEWSETDHRVPSDNYLMNDSRYTNFHNSLPSSYDDFIWDYNEYNGEYILINEEKLNKIKNDYIQYYKKNMINQNIKYLKEVNSKYAAKIFINFINKNLREKKKYIIKKNDLFDSFLLDEIFNFIEIYK